MAREGRGSFGAIDTINVTPLVDLTFLLLIVFMITAPVLEYSIEVEPPELDAAPIAVQEHRLVALDRDGSLYLDEERVTREDLAAALRLESERRPGIQVFVRADQELPYGEVISVLRVIKQAGLANFSLVTSPEGSLP